ncbi:MAG: hypothetical protein LBN28_01090 [Desulfovibrio sp.]|nr:hypothetical protein [Desulfovibrio sp.]
MTSISGCSSYQPTKNAWKSTKNFWNAYLSPPAEVNYEEKSDLSPRALELTTSMMGIDRELSRLERVMLNADKPPTRVWVTNFMTSFPWLNGFAGVKNDGAILGQEPAAPIKDLDFIPLLYEDKKQSSRALRADVQNTPLGPEIMLAAPLYDSVDFLGVVTAHFDMRTLAQYSGSPENMVILSPRALLWPGKYEYAATPLAGVDWTEIISNSSSGICKNVNGSFYYIVRYLGNLPLVFAVPESGSFPEGNGDTEQGRPFFPKEPEKLSPPPITERKSRIDVIAAPDASSAADNHAQPQNTGGVSSNDIEPGNRDSVLLKGNAPAKSRLEEHKITDDNVPAERVTRPRQATQPKAQQVRIIPDSSMPTLPGGRPSPFGPRDDDPDKAPSEDGSAKDAAQETPEGSSQNVLGDKPDAEPATLKPTEITSRGQTPASPVAQPEPQADAASDTQTPAPLPEGRQSPF